MASPTAGNLPHLQWDLCTCPSFPRFRRCKHILGAKLHLGLLDFPADIDVEPMMMKANTRRKKTGTWGDMEVKAPNSADAQVDFDMDGNAPAPKGKVVIKPQDIDNMSAQLAAFKAGASKRRRADTDV